jgi:hypothetical protein
MPIPMEIPARFLQRVIEGQAVRSGCILKDETTGQIIGHLKEVGQTATRLANVPLNPLTTVAQVGNWIDSHVQLRQIRQSLDHLQLISTLGPWPASPAWG